MYFYIVVSKTICLVYMVIYIYIFYTLVSADLRQIYISVYQFFLRNSMNFPVSSDNFPVNSSGFQGG